MEKNDDFTRYIWISYSGKNQNVVEDLILYIESDESKSKSQSANFGIKAFQRSIDNSEPIRKEPNSDGQSIIKYHLRPGDNIYDLIDVISYCPRRMILLSEDYLQSVYCLTELVCCLTREGESLIPVVSLINLDKDILTGDFSDRIAKLTNSKNLTLLLTRIYNEEVLEKLSPVFKLPEELFPEKFFEGKLAELSGKIYLKVDEGPSSNIKLWCEEVYDCFVQNKNNIDGNAKEKFDEFILSSLKGWSRKPFARRCLKESEIGVNNLIDAPYDVDTIRKLADVATDLLYEAPSGYSENHFKNYVINSKEAIQEFAGIVSLLVIDPVWAMEMRYSSINGTRLRFSYNEGIVLGNNQYLSCYLAASASHQAIPRLELEGNKINSTGMIPFRSLPVSREQIDTFLDEYIEEMLVRVFQEPKSTIKKYLSDDKTDWQTLFNSRVFSNKYPHKNSDNELVSVRFFVDDVGKFSQREFVHWDEVMIRLASIVNKGLPEDRKLKLGIVIAGSRDDGNSIQFFFKEKTNINDIIFIVSDLVEHVK